MAPRGISRNVFMIKLRHSFVLLSLIILQKKNRHNSKTLYDFAGFRDARIQQEGRIFSPTIYAGFLYNLVRLSLTLFAASLGLLLFSVLSYKEMLTEEAQTQRAQRLLHPNT